MSHYRRIQTNLIQGDALVRAITALGVVPAVSPDLHQNTLKVQNGWSDAWVSIRLTSEQLQAQGLISSRLFGGGAMGYRWSDEAQAYEVVFDQSSDSGKLARFNGMVAQRYGVEVAYSAAVAAGWSPVEETLADGSFVLTCSRY